MPNAFGYAYELKVYSSPDSGQQEITTYSSSDWEPESLRIQFTVEQTFSATWFADISIYNLNTQSQTQAIASGGIVQLFAGFTGNLGLIFQGTIYQPLVRQEGGVDYVTTLRCVSDIFNRTFVAASVSAGATQNDFLQAMVQSARTPVGLSVVQGQLRSDQYIRGKVAFGSARYWVEQIARDNGLASWRGSNAAAIGSIASVLSSAPDFTYAPRPQGGGTDPSINYTLIGSPEQTTSGVSFLVQLDSRLRFQSNPPLKVGLQGAFIATAAQQYGGTPLVPLNSTGVYVVAGVRHVGDNRGNEWYTEVTCVTPGGYASILQQRASVGA